MSEPIKVIDKLREFKLSTFAVDNGTSIFLLAFMILLFGVRSYIAIPKAQYPDAYLPNIFINTPYFGNSATDIENLITKPIEEELSAINGLKEIRSNSLQDFSIIIAEFSSDLSIDEALVKVKDAVDRAKSELPNDLDQEPIIEEIAFADFPIMTINLSGPFTMDQLRSYAEDLQDEIEDVKEVSKAVMKGALEREVKIDVDLVKMQSLKVSFRDIEGAIASENISMSGGEIVANEFRRSVRVVGEFKDVKELENLIIKSENERPIYLRDLGTVSYGFEERNSYARADGFPVISLEVSKRQGQNLLSAADNINATLNRLTPKFPENLTVKLFNDQSIYTRNEVSNLQNSIISGVILVVLILLFFLGLRNATFVGLAIPLSMLMGLMWLHLSDTTLNIVSLFSLILALGMLVDNAIVTVENIYRYMQNGFNGTDAAKYGASEVAMPIIASTATTLAAFLPLAFWPGILGEFFRYMPITLIVVLGSSLFVALVINPVFTSRFMKVDAMAEERSGYVKKRKNVLLGSLFLVLTGVVAHLIGIMWLRNLVGIAAIVALVNFFLLRPMSFSFQNKGLPVLENAYNRFIRFALKSFVPMMFFAGSFVLLFASIGLLMVKTPPVEFFPQPDPVYANAFIELPIGSDIEATNDLLLEFEEKVKTGLSEFDPIIESVLTQIGKETSDPNSPPEPGFTPHKARLTISFITAKERGELSSVDAVEELRNVLSGVPGVKVVIAKDNAGPPTGPPINIEIQGDNMDTIAYHSQKIISYINDEGIDGIEELKANINIGKPELIVNVNREVARRYGLSTAQIASTLRTSIYGKEVSKFKDGEDDYPIMLRSDARSRNNIDALMNQKITFRDQARQGMVVQIPINTVADFDYRSTYSSIGRLDQERVITVYSNTLPEYNANEVVDQVKGLMEDYDLPEGYSFAFTGEAEQQAEEVAFLSSAFLVALFSIFIIVVAQFNSIISPFIILLSVLFSTIGVFIGFALTGETISIVFTGIGIIALAGIVVNNAIVLIDYINLLVQNKRESLGIDKMTNMDNDDVKNAIIQGGATRLRPVLLTAITTILGLVPLALGINFNFFTLISDLDPQYFAGGDNTALWGPMAWTIIYGLVFATFLTLIIVPVMYWLAFRAKKYFSHKLFPRENKTVAA